MDYTSKNSPLKIGDKVRIKEDLIAGKKYYGETKHVSNVFTFAMDIHKGKVAEVVGTAFGQYILDIDLVNLYTYDMLHNLGVEDDLKLVNSEYVFNKEVENLVALLMKEQVYREIDKALEERLFETDPEKFNQLKSLLQ